MKSLKNQFFTKKSFEVGFPTYFHFEFNSIHEFKFYFEFLFSINQFFIQTDFGFNSEFEVFEVGFHREFDFVAEFNRFWFLIKFGFGFGFDF